MNNCNPAESAAQMASAARDGDFWSALGSSLKFQNQAPPLRSVSRRSPLPLSWAQERLWLIQQSEPESVAYNLAFAWRLSGPLNAQALDQSLAAIVRRHEIFQTVFRYQDGQPVQDISAAPFEGLALVDFRAHKGAEQKDRVSSCLVEESQRRFDLARGPLLRATLLRLGEKEHVLLLTMHHMVCDAASLDVLFRELRDFYEERIGGKPALMPALPVQYADFAAWQRSWLHGPALETQLAYWKKQLAGRLPVLELPADRPRTVQQSVRGALLHFDLPAELLPSLNELKRREGVTLFNILLAAFKALLYRYTGQSDLIIGSLTANRNRSELRNLIGFFANTLVMRTQVSGEMTFVELLARVRETVLDACANQDVPFQMLVKELAPSRDASYTPFFQVMFSFQSLPRRALELSGLRARMLPVDNGTAKFELTLVMNETAEGIAGWFEYNTDRFEAATTWRMAGHFQNLLAAAVANPTQPLWALPLLSKQERHRLIVEWNETAQIYDQSLGVHHLFEKQVARSPKALALAFGEQRLTYGELNARANCVAAHLLTLGVGRERLVGILMERSLEVVIALLAVLKTGAAYVPLDPSYPKSRLAFMIKDANLSVLLTQRNFESLPEVPGGRTVLVDKLLAGPTTVEAREKALPEATNTPDLMYVIYTSGSTGTPKGVQVSHRSVVNLLTSMRQRPGLKDTDRLLALTTISFDIAVLELFLPLTVGAQVVIAPSEMALTPAVLAAEIERRGITIMQATPTAWRILIDSGWTGNKRLKALCGGESLPSELAHRLLERCGELWNLYGPTETTVWSALHRVERVDGPVPIGRPIANTQLYVLDSGLQPVPVGVEGELYIGGDGLARGYLNRPELTSEKFIAHPLHPGARLYRTGDRARYLADGNLVCVGRSDHQVKIRGFRIELGEIEALLEQHPSVLAAVVTADRETNAESRLLAYWISQPNHKHKPAPAEFRKFMEQRLPGYMIPAVFTELAEFPLTPNGKVDRSRLPKPSPNRDCLEGACEAPDSPLEALLAQIWQEVLNQKTVGVKDDFFELGGHSLAMMQVISRLNANLHIEVPIATFLQSPTISRLAEAISGVRPDQTAGN